MVTSEQERQRIEREYRRIEKERARERKEEDRRWDAQRRLREAEAELRNVEIRTRLERLGLGDLISTGVHTALLDKDGAHPEVWVSIKAGQSVKGESELVVLELLRRLEAVGNVFADWLCDNGEAVAAEKLRKAFVVV